MEWLKAYWWLILIVLLGIFINTIKDLNKTSFKSYLNKKNGIKPIPYDDDEDDWPKEKKKNKTANSKK
ncbi:hypothetical protein RHO14_04865 [Orbus wheelerorum]|uniref:hypothetical protein n=1 Tax=Orbus wheelerorum TaxID=3074111 RepID=UPI00370D877A